MDIGFTGTQEGMTGEQLDVVYQLVSKSQAKRAHHGMCIGADLQFHNVCRELGLFIVGHPGVNSQGLSPKQALCLVDELKPEKPYLERNKDIVEETRVLIATPKEFEEQLRSGTWATIRRARILRRPTFIIYPNGTKLAL